MYTPAGLPRAQQRIGDVAAFWDAITEATRRLGRRPLGVANLVLTHLSPAHNDPERWALAQNGYSGTLVVGEDLMQLGVGGT